MRFLMISKKLIFVFLMTLIGSAYAQELSNGNDLQVSATREESRFHIKVSYLTSRSLCEAFSYLTDYEGAKKIPGIVESKVIQRQGNKVIVERLIRERILFFPIELRSTIEYSELPNQGLNFIQTKGDNKSYMGTWRLQEDAKGVQVRYESFIEPDSVIPNAVVEYFISNNIRRRFEIMSDRMEHNQESFSLACK